MATNSYYGSINVTDLLEKLREKNSCFVKADNQKIYCNVTLWENEELDKYGNTFALQSSSTKEAAANKEPKFYLGNFKKSKAKKITDKDMEAIDVPDDIPTISKGADGDDLPF